LCLERRGATGDSGALSAGPDSPVTSVTAVTFWPPPAPWVTGTMAAEERPDTGKKLKR
jgi:hypothetical protein